MPPTERETGGLPQQMGARGIRKVLRRRQRKGGGADSLLWQIVSDEIGKLLVDSDDFVPPAKGMMTFPDEVTSTMPVTPAEA